MGNISTYLQQIMNAVYGEQVRSAIHDAINQCYIDASAGITPTITVTPVDGGTRVDIAVGADIISFVVQNGTATTQEVQYYVTEWLEENPDFYTTEVELLSGYIDDLATTGTYTKKNFYRCTSGRNSGTAITENSKQAYVVLTQQEATAHSIIYDNSVYAVEVIKVRDGSVISQSIFVTTSPVPYLDGTYDTAIINFKRQDEADLTAMERRLTLFYESSVGGVALASDLDDKVDKVTGKGLSTEDYTTAEKTKLAGLTQIEVDDTLSVEGRAADAKATGDKISELNSVLNKSTGNELFNDFVTKRFITNNESTYDLSTPSTDNAFCYIVVDASEGDVFTIKGVGGFTPRLWSFVDGDTSGNILSKANASATGNDLVITAPTGTTHLIVNSRMDANPYVYRGLILEKRVYDLEDKTSDAEQSIDGLELFALGVPNGGTIESMQLTSNDFFQGLYGADSIIETNGELASTKRIGLTNPVRCVAGTKVTYAMDSDQLLSVKVFANPPGTSQTALQESSWLSGTGLYVINYNGYLIVNVRRSGDAVIAPSDFSSTVVLHALQYYDFVEEINERLEDIKSETVGVGTSPYYGQKIRLDAFTYKAEQVGSVAIDNYVPQSSAIYGDELFTMYTGVDLTKSKFSVYNLLTNTVSGIFFMDSNIPYLHCNSACFGNKQNSNDDYPILYINSYMDNAVGKGVCFAIKITKSGSSYSASLVQKISLDFTDQEIWTGKTMNPQTLAAGNWIVDTAGNRLIAYTTQGFDRTRFFVFELPDTSVANVTLTQNDILDYFDVAYIANIQDSCLHNGMIYLTSGIDWGDYDQILRVYAINLSGRCIVSEIPLEKSASVMRTEPEGIDYYNGALIVTTVTKRVMRLVF